MGLTLRIAAIVLLLDQATKILVVHLLNLKGRGEIDVAPPFVVFRMAWNRGINFGLFSGNSDMTRWVLVGLALAICVGVLAWMWRSVPGPRVQVSAGLLVGGAIGNVIDRLVYGAVADFLNMSCCGIDNPYAFNVADVAIFLGAVGLILFSDGERPRDGRRRAR